MHLNKLIKSIINPKIAGFCLLFGILLAFLGFYIVITSTPDDYLQGTYFKIMYVHVPNAWLSMMLYLMLAAFSALYLIFRNPLYHLISLSCAEIGTLCTIITLLTGMIWGKPTWGTWWVWDARLTSVLLLMFIYIAYLMIYHSIPNKEGAAKVAAIFSIIGLVNIPIIKFSVYLWATLHQQSTFITLSGPKIHSSMLQPFIIVFLGILLWVFGALNFRIGTYLLNKKITSIQAK